jgi:NhaA family Na+:H+ antiporter
VPLGGDLFETLTSTVALGIVAGLVVGKQLGITLFAWLAVKSGLSDLPEGVTWRHVYGAGWLAGIGFTMSLFISDLAFADSTFLNTAKLGILAASLIAGLVGWTILRGAGAPRRRVQ